MKKIALYGLGVETEKALKKLSDKYAIVGLLDGYKTEGFLYGIPIISFEKAVWEGVERIVVVARPGSCKAIAKRIADLCRTNHIELYDIRGNNLLNNKRKIFSQKELRELLEEIESQQNLSDRIRLDMLKSRLFQIQESALETNRIMVSDPYDIGYLFCAPIITDFIIWFAEFVQKEKIPNVWFFARDGYLIHKLYKMLYPKRTGQYVYTSRIAAIRAGVESVEDLLYIDSMKFSGTLGDNLQERFGLSVEEPIDDFDDGILQYKEAILNKAAEVRKGYRKYAERFITPGEDIAVFDFVAKGTVQYFMERIVPNHLKGLYFLQLEPDYMREKNLDIIPFYRAEELEKSVIFDDYYILETILMSPEPSVIEFDQNGIPIFAAETRAKSDIECIGRIQNGIVDYFKEYMCRCPKGERKCNKTLDEVFLSLIHNVDIVNDDFKKLMIEDPFFNRETKMTDVL